MAIGAAGPSVTDYAQCQNGNPRSANLDCPSKWINGILNATHSDYSEDQVVPQRALIDYGSVGTGHSVQISYLARKSGGGQHHAYDYLATWNYTQKNAERCQTPTATACPAGPASTFPIPTDGATVLPGAPQPTSAHELPQADRQFVMYGGTITGTSAVTHSTGVDADGSDYGIITVNFNVTAADGKVQLLFGGHLAAGFGPRGWGANLGAADISGGPYHIRLTAIDGASIGNRDNQIMSSAIQPVPAPSLEITKTADAATVNAGGQIGFTITVHNAGPGVANNVTLSDPLPGGSGVSWSESPGVAACSISGTAPTQTLNCSFGNLAADASASVHVVSDTTFASCKKYENTATADADNHAAVTASDDTTVQCPSLVLSKTPDGGTVNAGSNISFTLTLTNNGAGAATNVNIDDTLPAGFSWSESPDKTECSITSGALHCDVASLASGASFAVTVTAATDANDCGKVTNHATADADNHAQVSNDGDVTVECADVGVLKTGNGPIDAGDTATFTIVVTASGNADSTNVSLSDNLPAGVTWTLGGADAAQCGINAAADPDALSCDFGTMAPHASKTITLSGTADKGECPSISNTAEVSSDFDTNSSNDSSSASITVNCGTVVLTKTPDLATDNGGTVNAGGTATFTIVVENTGSGTARGVQVSDQLPDVSGTWTDDNANCSVNASNLLTCNLGDMAAHASITIHLSTTVTTDDCGTLDNPVASVTTTNDGSSEDSGSIKVTCPNLKITKTTDTPTVAAGGEVQYTITIDNSAGDGTAKDVTVSDALPAGLTWTDDSADCTVTGSDLSCGPLDISAGESFSVTLTGTTDPADCPSISNFASFDSANAGSGTTESDPTVITVNCPNASVEKTAGDASVNAGDQVSYDITVTAGGTGDSTGVSLNDELPSGIDWSLGGTNAGDCSIDSSGTPSVLSCDFGTMAHGTSKSITVSGTAGPEDCGTLQNTATVDADVDVNTQNNSAGPVAIDVNCPDVTVPTLVIDKAADHTTVDVTAGKDTTVTWTLTYTLANGPVTNAVTSDPLPTGLNYVADSASNDGAYDAASRTLTWTFASLSTSGSVTFKTTVDASVGGGVTLLNIATIDSNETAPDSGQASIGTAEQEQQGATGTPAASVPNTALGSTGNGQPLNVPVWLMLLVFVGSLGGLALANVKAVQRRR